MSKKESLPVWPLAGPFYQYNEDVKALASAARLRIVDVNSMPADPPFPIAPKADWPKVTIRDEFKPAKPAKDKASDSGHRSQQNDKEG